MLKVKLLLGYTNLFFSNKYENNKYLGRIKCKNTCCVICGKYRKFRKSKISNIFEKTLLLSIICSKCKNEDETIYILTYLKLTNKLFKIYELKKLRKRKGSMIK